MMILIAEDDEQILRLLQRAFEREGYDVLTAKDGQEALDLVSTHHPPLLLSDIWMPRVDGIALVEALPPIYADKPRPKVILMSAFESEPAVPVDAFLPKPFDLQDLIDLVDSLADSAAQVNGAGPEGSEN